MSSVKKSTKGKNKTQKTSLKKQSGEPNTLEATTAPSSSVLDISNEEHRSARRLVFEKIVAATIQDPNHPYYSMLSKNLRQEMIEEITEQLVDSHYLNG